MNKRITKLVLAFGPFFVDLYLRHVYRRWSRLYRWLWERKYRDVPLTEYTGFIELARVVRSKNWVADGPRQLWDAISTPQAAQWLIDARDSKQSFDCDEFAIYLCNVIQRALQKGAFADPNLVEACFFTVTWIVPSTGEMGGHNVCGLRWNHKGKDVYGYMDYGMPLMAMFSWAEVAERVRIRYAGTHKVVSLGWSRHTPELDFIEASK